MWVGGVCNTDNYSRKWKFLKVRGSGGYEKSLMVQVVMVFILQEVKKKIKVRGSEGCGLI